MFHPVLQVTRDTSSATDHHPADSVATFLATNRTALEVLAQERRSGLELGGDKSPKSPQIEMEKEMLDRKPPVFFLGRPQILSHT